MPVVFLAHNGLGLGHLRRTEILARAAKGLGFDVRLVVQGFCPPELSDEFETMRIRPLRGMAPAEIRAARSNIEDMCCSSPPHCVIEDTHPSDLVFDAAVRRHLVVRPTTFGYLCELKEKYGTTYQGFFVADSPESPTWPYTESETRTIIEEWQWRILGPVFYRAVRAPLSHEFRDRRLVVAVGGGGQHQGREDLWDFFARAGEVTRAVRSADPFASIELFRGPYLAEGLAIPRHLTVREYDPRFPYHLSRARAAFIRPGFNTLWECLAAGTPFQPLLTATYVEPSQRRIDNLRNRGAILNDLVSAWWDEDSLRLVHEAIIAIARPFSGIPPKERMHELCHHSKDLVPLGEQKELPESLIYELHNEDPDGAPRQKKRRQSKWQPLCQHSLRECSASR